VIAFSLFNRVFIADIGVADLAGVFGMEMVLHFWHTSSMSASMGAPSISRKPYLKL